MKRNEIVQKLRELAKEAETEGMQIPCAMANVINGHSAIDGMCSVHMKDAINYLADMFEE